MPVRVDRFAIDEKGCDAIKESLEGLSRCQDLWNMVRLNGNVNVFNDKGGTKSNLHKIR